MRVLIVEDDDPIRNMLANVVSQQLDMTVETARNGREAIAKIDDDGYDALVLDLMMPLVDGYAVIQHLEARHPELLPKTLVASAVPQSEALFRLPSFRERYHAKPFDIGKLLAAIRAVGTGPILNSEF